MVNSHFMLFVIWEIFTNRLHDKNEKKHDSPQIFFSFTFFLYYNFLPSLLFSIKMNLL